MNEDVYNHVLNAIDETPELTGEDGKPDLRHPLAVPLWEMYRAARLAELHSDSADLVYDDPKLSADLRYCAHILRQCIADQFRLYSVPLENLRLAMEMDAFYTESAGISPEAEEAFADPIVNAGAVGPPRKPR